MLTRSEYDRLKQRLEGLLTNRAAISERIAEARELGDLKENAEYHAAREQQGLEEAEIRRLTDMLATTQVIEEGSQPKTDMVFLGCTVKIRDLKNDDEEMVRLVGEASGLEFEDYTEVTLSSPMGEALLKARVGETVSVRAPRGVKQFLIVEIV
ncbi:MAG: transcription elongation factor GreA [Phycisphaerales bacterium]|nr:transcription elongation factor GreA [Phycisphaerales bacterium]